VKYVLLFVLTLGACATELLTNGDFEQPLDSGWVVDSGGHARPTLGRAPDLQPDPDYEARIHLGPADGYAAIAQTVPVPGVALRFRADLCLYAHMLEQINWAAASCRIAYRDSTLAPLGETRIYVYHRNCPWQNTSTLHLVLAPDSFWHSYGFDVAAELASNLPGVDPTRVRYVTVALRDTAGAS
jgi:hypothetical protein